MDYTMNGRVPYLGMMQPPQQRGPGLFGFAPPPPTMQQQMQPFQGDPMMSQLMQQPGGGGQPGGQGGQNLLSPETFMKLMQMFGGG